MVKTYSGKSPRNARIKIDYTGECPSVSFKYPRKDGYVGSMTHLVFLVWILFCSICYIFFSLTVLVQDISQDISQNNTSVNETLVNGYGNETYLMDKSELIRNILTLLILFIPPLIINKLFKKKLNALFPIYQAWRADKKYVEFKAKDIKTSIVNGKKEIYVEIPYFQNIILKYEATKDFSKYLDIMEIKEQNFKTKEYSSKEKKWKERKKKKRKVKKQNEWYWYAKFYFNEVPKNGKLSVIYK